MPRTPDGQPDLQGVWANNAATPLERPQRIADKASLTDAELVKLKARAEELFSGDGDAAFGDSVFQTALVDGAEYTSPDGGTGNYNAFWVVDRAFDHRTSLIVDPPNGRFPPLTEEALTRQRAGAASFRTDVWWNASRGLATTRSTGTSRSTIRQPGRDRGLP